MLCTVNIHFSRTIHVLTMRSMKYVLLDNTLYLAFSRHLPRRSRIKVKGVTKF